jgi:tripartite ATP-independent transporter DctM subunit
LIVYAFASGGASIASLFLAGYLPGLLLGLCLMLVAGYYSYQNGYPKGDKVSYKETFIRFLDSIPSILLIVIVIGGIVAGYFTATEASAIAVLYAFILAVPVYGEVKWREIPDVLLQTSKTTAIVMFLIAASIAMSWMLSFEQIPQYISSALLAASDSKFVILLLINVILLVVGTFMDVTPAILIFTPIFMPVVTELGVDPVHFGIIVVLNLCVGLCTPPVGTALFVGTSIADTTISKMVKPLLPLYAVMIIWLFIVTFVPELSLYLPRVFGF